MNIIMTDQLQAVFKAAVESIDVHLRDLDKELAERPNGYDRVAELCRMSMQDMEHKKFILEGLIKKYEEEKERS